MNQQYSNASDANTDSVSAGSIRAANQGAFRAALSGELPDPTILADALAMGHPDLVLECRVCRLVGLSSADEARVARDELQPILAEVARGSNLSSRWRWTLEHVAGITADEFSDFDTAWASHQAAFEIASELKNDRLLSVSELYLGYTHYRLDMREDALTRLFGVLGYESIPEQTEIVAHCLVGLVLSDMGEEALAFKHWTQAMGLVRKAREPIANATLRILVRVAAKTSDFSGAFQDVGDWRSRSGALGSRSDSELELWHVRASFYEGRNDEALVGARSLFSQIDSELAFRGEVAVVLVETLLAAADFEGALIVLDHDSLQPPPPFHELAMVDARRRSLKELGRWKEAAECFESARPLHRKRRLASTSIYEIQVKAAEDRRLADQTRELERRNAELISIVEDQAAVSELILNKIQSPMTSLQLILDMLGNNEKEGEDPPAAVGEMLASLGSATPESASEGVVAEGPAAESAIADDSMVKDTSAKIFPPQRIGIARRAVRRMSDVVLEIRQSGALDGIETHQPDLQDLGLNDVLERLVLTHQAYLHDHSMTLNLENFETDQRVSVDPYLVHQLVGALIRGIVEFGSAGANVWIRALDTGPGRVTVVLECAELRLPDKLVARLEASRIEGRPSQNDGGDPENLETRAGSEVPSNVGGTEADLASDLSITLALKVSQIGSFELQAERRSPSGTFFSFVIG